MIYMYVTDTDADPSNPKIYHHSPMLPLARHIVKGLWHEMNNFLKAYSHKYYFLYMR